MFASIGITLDAVSKYSAFWEKTRTLYGPFECTTTMKSGNADVYLHEIPGGQVAFWYFRPAAGLEPSTLKITSRLFYQ
jgi:pyruvate carboxylase